MSRTEAALIEAPPLMEPFTPSSAERDTKHESKHI
ncbi:hypothetical protein CGLO_13088 [Colletotrichum gloeosporioides Cg-14]|uniref:Uncharacterized protein n=1 Tax=Colletotrichum gloeosporioides (strain Cg-14) TaxID=1237896 RepID=T0JX63_COLGC|nr:hypothetical protein CGLO_13088 [Colletotrichum gloeosporioides Cg-14]